MPTIKKEILETEARCVIRSRTLFTCALRNHEKAGKGRAADSDHLVENLMKFGIMFHEASNFHFV